MLWCYWLKLVSTSCCQHSDLFVWQKENLMRFCPIWKYMKIRVHVIFVFFAKTVRYTMTWDGIKKGQRTFFIWAPTLWEWDLAKVHVFLHVLTRVPVIPLHKLWTNNGRGHYILYIKSCWREHEWVNHILWQSIQNLSRLVTKKQKCQPAGGGTVDESSGDQTHYDSPSGTYECLQGNPSTNTAIFRAVWLKKEKILQLIF